MPASMVFTAFHAYGGGTGGWLTAAGPGLPRTSRATPITVMRAGSITSSIGSWVGSWNASQTRADHRCDSLDEYDEYIAMDGGVHAIEPEIWSC